MHEMLCLADFCKTKRISDDVLGKLVQQTVAEHARLYRDHSPIGRAVELPVQAHFHNLNFWNLKDVSHKSFVFAPSTVGT